MKKIVERLYLICLIAFGLCFAFLGEAIDGRAAWTDCLAPALLFGGIGAATMYGAEKLGGMK